MAAPNDPLHTPYSGPGSYAQQIPRQKPVRVDPFAPLPTSFAPAQNADNPSWPEEVQRNSVATPEQPIDDLARTASRKRRVSGTGRGPRRSQMASYPQPQAPDVAHTPPTQYQDPQAMNGKVPQASNPTSFAARARGLPDNGDATPADAALEDEYTADSAKPKRREGSRRRHRPLDSDQLELGGRETSDPRTVQGGVPVQQRRMADIPVKAQYIESKAEQMDGAPPAPNPNNATSLARSSTRKTSNGQADPRKEWASDRSPLQKLEVKLNDISKEEKRARVEKAEQRLRDSKAYEDRQKTHPDMQPAENLNLTGYPATGNRNKIETALEQTRQDSQRQGDSRSRRLVAPAYAEDVDQQQFERNQAFHSESESRDPAVPSTGKTRSRLSEQQPLQPSQASPISDQQGHRGVRFHSHQDNELTPTDLDKKVTQRLTENGSLSGVAGQTARPQERRGEGQLAMGARTSKEVPNQQQALYSGRARRSGKNEDPTAHGGAPDPVPAMSVRTQSDAVKYEIPPQTAAGIEARQKVGFGGDTAGPLGGPVHHKHHLSNLLHRGHNNAPNNAPQLDPQPRHLEEWRQGGVARLTADDLRVPKDNSSTQNAWWERGSSKTQGASDALQSQRNPGVKSVGYADDYRQDTRSFDPPLYLQCGPLLRYTGLKRDKLQASRIGGGSGVTERESWRGSVMIVTIDSESDYSAPPSLRLFPEPIDLLPPPPQQVDGEGEHNLPSEYIDPIAGLPKLSRTGTTVYVKPVEDLEPEVDLSRVETDDGLFEETRTAAVPTSYGKPDPRFFQPQQSDSKTRRLLGKANSKYRSVRGVRLHAERGVTFWRFNLEVELSTQETRIAYSINNGSSVGFWVPARGQSMNVMFHSCNGFSMSVNSANFSGPDPLWRDVLNNHQTRPFHVMIGGGDQIYNDAVMTQTKLFQEWLDIKASHHKHEMPFSPEMQEELESFYLDRYLMWFSQGLFGMANSQIPMINLWDDHDIIDGFGSYPHHFMSTPVFCGLGAVAFKYYMLFQHQSVPAETSADEPSWLLGAAPGPYINELSRSVLMSLGKRVTFLGLDCRTERQRDMILSQASYELVFDRCRREILSGETKHLIVLLGVPIAYPRLVWLENLLTSRVMDPIKALGRTGMLGGFLNKFDGGVEILDDLDDHWTAKNHKQERKYFIEELQELAALKSVRVTILGGDVHLAAVGQFYSNPKLRIPKDRDHRYMANIISSAIVNTPPPEMMGDILNKRNKTHHFDYDTEEDMIPMFTHDVDGKNRNNKRLLPRRNWCSIREYHPGSTPPPTPSDEGSLMSEGEEPKPGPLKRTLSLTRNDIRPGNLLGRLSQRGPSQEYPPFNEYRTLPIAAPSPPQRVAEPDGYLAPQARHSISGPPNGASAFSSGPLPRPGNFHRRPTNMSIKAIKKGGAINDENEGHINLEHGLDIVLNCEVSQKDPAGITVPYRLLIPALSYEGEGDINEDAYRKKNLLQRFSSLRGSKRRNIAYNQGQGNWGQSQESYSRSATPSSISERQARQDAGTGKRGGAMGLLRSLSQGASSRRKLTKDSPLQEQRDGDVEERLGSMGLFQRRPSTRDGTKAQQQGAADGQVILGPGERIEGIGLSNRWASNPARVGPISQPQPISQGPSATTRTTTTIQGGEQPQRRASTAERVEGMGLFPRRAASTNTRPPPHQQSQAQTQAQSQPLSLRTMEARASQQQQRDFERGHEAYPGRRPSKLDRVLGIGNARDEPDGRKGASFAARQGADGADDDYYSGVSESISELSAAGKGAGVGKGYGGIEAYKEQKGWRRFF